jgi:hypothetical protein
MGYDVGIPTHDVGTMLLDLHIDLTLYSYMPTGPWLSDELRQHQDNNPAYLKISVSEVLRHATQLSLKRNRVFCLPSP